MLHQAKPADNLESDQPADNLVVGLVLELETRVALDDCVLVDHVLDGHPAAKAAVGNAKFQI